MWQLLYAGAAGGRKGVPETIRAHPLVFATLTAPGFGAVHGTREDPIRRAGPVPPAAGPAGGLRARPADLVRSRTRRRRRPARATAVRRLLRLRRSRRLQLARAGAVAPVHHRPAPDLARRAGLTPAEHARRCRLSFVKVAEFQRRAVVHFHALIRLDGPGGLLRPAAAGRRGRAGRRDPRSGGRGPAHRRPARRRRGDAPVRRADRHATGQRRRGRRADPGPGRRVRREVRHQVRRGLRARRPAADARPRSPARACPRTSPGSCGPAGTSASTRTTPACAAGFTWRGSAGTSASKSRRYSTTLGAIRGERREYRRRQDADRARLAGQPDRDEETTLVVSRWELRRHRLPHRRRCRAGAVRGCPRPGATRGRPRRHLTTPAEKAHSRGHLDRRRAQTGARAHPEVVHRGGGRA